MKAGVRLTGGQWGGRRIAVAKGVRPSSGRLREALASHWQDKIAGARFLDLYTGSGAMTLEVLGRGAQSAVAVDGSRAVTDRLVDLAEAWNVSHLNVKLGQLPIVMAEIDGPFDLVFADPPYQLTALDRLLLAVAPLLAERGECAVEVRSSTSLPESVAGLRQTWYRKYGDSGLAVYGRKMG